MTKSPSPASLDRHHQRPADDPDQTPGEAPQVRPATGVGEAVVIPPTGRYRLTDGGRMLAVVPCADQADHPSHEHHSPAAAYGLWCEPGARPA